MILIGLGGNLPGKNGTNPVDTLQAALDLMERKGLKVVKKSPWYRSEPIPKSTQPWFVNGVVAVETALQPVMVLETLLEVEKALGRERGSKNEARIIDIDLLDYRGEILKNKGHLVLPHPRLHQRLFVLKPLFDIAPFWKHPVSGKSVQDLMATIGSGQNIEPLVTN